MKLLYFKTDWCATCHAIENSIPSYAEQIDCDKDQQTPISYNVTNVPVFIAVDATGKEIARVKSTNMKLVDFWFNKLTIPT